MREIYCQRCNDYCAIRESKRRDKTNRDILICGEVITHQDGSKEFKEYGRVNEKTNHILSFNPM